MRECSIRGMIDLDMVNAPTRRAVILDRLVGYNSPFLSCRKIRRGLSTRRVQSVAVPGLSRPGRGSAVPAGKNIGVSSINFGLRAPSGRLKRHFLWNSKEGKIKLHNQGRNGSDRTALEGAEYTVLRLKKGHRNPVPAVHYLDTCSRKRQKLGFRSARTMKVAQEL